MKLDAKVQITGNNNIDINISLYLSDDLLVSEEVFEVGNLEIGGDTHNYDWNDAEHDDAGLDLLVLLLETLFIFNEIAEFSAELPHHVLHLLGLDFNWAEMFFSDDVWIVLRLYSSLDHEIELSAFLIFVQYTDLVVATDVGGESVSQLWVALLCQII